MTVLLSAGDLRRFLDVEASLEALRQGFSSPHAQSWPPQRIRQALPSEGSIAIILPGLLPDIPAYTVKVNAKYPGSDPAITGVICLHDLETGRLLALLDSSTVTAWRTGLSAALATHLLALPTATTLGIVGAGAQAALTMRGLTHLRPLKKAVIYDLELSASRRLADAWRDREVDCVVARNLQEVTDTCDMIIAATWSRRPLLRLQDVRPGVHITSLGADEPGKAELDSALLRDARVIVDDADLAVTSGALGTAGLSRETAAATLGQIITRTEPGRIREDQRTVYTPVGLPWQDLALSWTAFQACQTDADSVQFDFLHGRDS
ncbi:MAG: ornithine cyclodeaminase family protein [Streptosporangiaceae bacterium]